MKQLYPLLIFLLFGVHAYPQGQANIWYFGATAGVDFNSGSPVAITDGVLSTNEGSATISDAAGNLLFYTDGIRVWNRNHVQMPNGNGLLGDPSSAQSGIIVPKPGSSTRYYIFTVAAQGNPGGFCYSEVDMTLNGGLGDVITATKNTQLFTPAVEKCAAVKHANGLYIWVIAHGFNNNTYYAYLVDCSGVSAPVTSAVGQVEGWPGWGCLTASNDGTKLASAMRTIGFELLDFNNATGVVSNPVFLGNANECYGVAFSPDNNLLYGLKINNGTTWQWDLQAGTPAAIVASMVQVGTAVGSGYRGGTLQLGPDGKIYFPEYGTPWLGVINNPNQLGAACGFTNNAVSLSGRTAYLGLPPFIQNYFDTADLILYSAPGCVNSPVAFTINSNTTFLDSVHWNFGDAGSGAQNTSGLVAPTHTYTVAGTYTIQLIRYLGCIADTSVSDITIDTYGQSTQNVTICPGSAYILPGGGMAAAAGTYIDTIPAAGRCDSIVTTNLTVAQAVVNAGSDVAICNGDNTQLNATGGLIYNWSPATGLSSTTIANPVANPTATTSYVVTSQIPAGNAIVNSDFSSGNTGFSSSYTYTTNNTTEGQIYVGPNAAAWNGGMAPCGDHTTGTGNMLCVNGATAANVTIYCQTVSVEPNTDYAFSTWLVTLSPGNLAQLQFSINGSPLGAVFTAPANTCNWQQFYSTWNSGSNTSANICILNQNTNAGANDFALDDISFSLLCTATDTVTVTVNPTYNQTVNTTICQGESYTLPDGTAVSATGSYVSNLTTGAGCDSIITTNLTVYPTYSYTVSQTICPSDLYILPGGTPVNTTGVYRDTLNTVNGCDSIIITNFTVVPPTMAASNDTQLCKGNAVQLNASGGLYTYSWTPATNLSDPNIPNPVATPVQTTSYIVTTQVASADLIGNGGFESGNAAFTSSYTYQSDVTPAGTYYVGNNPNTYHSGFSACPDHTTGAGNMMIVNGAGTPNTSVWCQTINVVPNTNYAFGCWAESVSAGSPAILQFSINSALLGAPFTVPATVCQWQQFYAVWNSGSNTTADICIVNQNTTGGGNDFALDDISFVSLCNVSDTVTIVVHNPDTVLVNAAICDGDVYTFPDGGTGTVSMIDTSLLLNRYGCDSTVITNLTVNPVYAVDVYDTICANQSYTLPDATTVTTAGTYTTTLLTINGCDSVITTYLHVWPVSATTVTDTICTGSTYTLPDGNTVNTSGSYVVTLANIYGCDSVVTTVLTVINVGLTAQVTDVQCNSESTGAVAITATGGVLPYTYVLSQAGSVLQTNTQGAFAALAAGSYTIDVTDNFGCTATIGATVSEPALLVATDTVSHVTCYGLGNGQVVVNTTGGTVPYTYSLTGQPDNATGVFAGLQAGSYTYVVTDDNGCTQTAAVVITEPQQVQLNVVPLDATINLGDTLQLAATSNYDPATIYLWSPANGLSCTDCANPVVTTYNSMEYTVQVTADVNGNSCTAVQPVTVTVIPRYDLFIPNTFTPNSDGNNDVFRIYGRLQALKYIDVQIFNRIGEKVYESNDLNFAWDGTYKGAPLNPAVFVYTLRAVFVDDHTEELYKGTITLIK